MGRALHRAREDRSLSVRALTRCQSLPCHGPPTRSTVHPAAATASALHHGARRTTARTRPRTPSVPFHPHPAPLSRTTSDAGDPGPRPGRQVTNPSCRHHVPRRAHRESRRRAADRGSRWRNGRTDERLEGEPPGYDLQNRTTGHPAEHQPRCPAASGAVQRRGSHDRTITRSEPGRATIAIGDAGCPPLRCGDQAPFLPKHTTVASETDRLLRLQRAPCPVRRQRP